MTSTLTPTEVALAADYADLKENVYRLLMDLRCGEDDYGPYFKLMLDMWTSRLGMENYVPKYTGPTTEGTCLRLNNGSIAVLVGSNSVGTPWSVIDAKGSTTRKSSRDIGRAGYVVLGATA